MALFSKTIPDLPATPKSRVRYVFSNSPRYVDLTEGTKLLEEVQLSRPIDIWLIGLKLWAVELMYPLVVPVVASLSTDMVLLSIMGCSLFWDIFMEDMNLGGGFISGNVFWSSFLAF